MLVTVGFLRWRGMANTCGRLRLMEMGEFDYLIGVLNFIRVGYTVGRTFVDLLERRQTRS